MKQLKQLFNKFFKRRQPKYGAGIFYQRTWLSQQVDEALYKRF
jgi:hypothetical protein